MSKPQVIDDAGHERVFDRVAAIDVAKKEGVVCMRLPHPAQPRGRRSLVWTVTATMSNVGELAARLAAEGVQKVTLESTSDYWRIWFYVLEAAGLDVQLVNASQARNLPGRPKTDKLDAMWLARLTENGLLRPSFVPPAQIRALRHYTRARARLISDRTRCWQRMEKLLEDALIKVSAVASKLTTLSAQDMIRALVAGQRDPQVLAGLARTRMKAKHAALAEALTGMFTGHHAELAQLLLDQAAFIDTRIARLNILISEQLAGIGAAWGIDADGSTGPDAGAGPDAIALPAAARLDEATGISAELAAGILAETGLDMSQSPPPATWCPGPGSRAAPSSPAPAPATARAGATATCAATCARPPSARPAPAPSSASATAGSPAAAAPPGPRSPPPAPSWSSSGTCWLTPLPATTTSAPATTRAKPTATKGPQPHPPAPSPRIHRHHHPSHLTPITPVTGGPQQPAPPALPHAHLRSPIFRSVGWAGRPAGPARACAPPDRCTAGGSWAAGGAWPGGVNHRWALSV